jgi:hypothetical protein
MSDILKKPYEISIWEDVLTTATLGDGTQKQYYKEQKIAVIGSNTMTTKARAISPKLTRNVNGTHTLSFNIYYKYFDEDEGKEVDNPFIKLLVNERKIKLKYDNKWYDLIIKSIQENSENRTFSYTAKDQYINELSKNGFNIELKTELENNQGNIVELGTKILEGTDWEVGSSEIIKQTIEEPLYKVVVKNEETLSGYNIENSSETITIPGGSSIYVFYSVISEEKPYFQFLYRADGDYDIDDDRVILNSPNYALNDNIEYIDNIPNFAISATISDEYRGDRLVRTQKSKYDEKIDKYVLLYNKSGESSDKIYYGYTGAEYISPVIVQNFLVNNSEFTSDVGWAPDDNSLAENYIDPPINSETITETTFSSYMGMKFGNTNSLILNTGIEDYRRNINEFSKGEKYVFRIKYGRGSGKNQAISSIPTSQGLRAKVIEYEMTGTGYTELNKYFDFTGNFKSDVSNPNSLNDFLYLEATCLKSITYREFLEKNIGFFLYRIDTSNYYYSIKEIQFFKYIKDSNGEIVFPGDAPESGVNLTYYYYDPSTNYESLEDLVFDYKGEKTSGYIPIYNNNFEKIRSIEASESNRFNLIQDLCETFECWADFQIEHLENGEIAYDENYKPIKKIVFKEFIGKDNYVGFRYGINLKSIQRTIDSDQIVSKIIVKNNSNQFAEDGFCSIARAEDNPIKENFLYNFNYYIQQGLLDFSEVNNDLYLNANGYLAYYVKLRQINSSRDELIYEQSEISNVLIKLTADQQTYQLARDEAAENELRVRQELKNYSGYSYENFINNPTSTIKNRIDKDPQIQQMLTEIKVFAMDKEKYGVLYQQKSSQLEDYQAKYDNITDTLDQIVYEKEELNKKFYEKYSRFIQEGSWISEDYVDDNLYYLDSESVLYTSAFPKVSYTINVLELSELDEYKDYKYDIGDKTYMEDTKFFGWVIIDGVKTPYREEIVVSEITNDLDSPEQNQIKVQNYKNQFEDLFQRITATTQSVQYQSGSYARAAGIVETDGNIKPETLQDSLINNALILSNAKDESVFWDDTGITSTNLANPYEIIRIVSGGIFITSDGGKTWSTGIKGTGINATNITSGQINTQRIQILNGNFPSFKWDSHGINAYSMTQDPDNPDLTYFNFGKFVRFDQYGLYGIKGSDDFYPQNSQEIREKANFGFTWDGFFLKTQDGSVSISTEEDIQIFKREIERIKIGKIESSLEHEFYGMGVSNKDGDNILSIGVLEDFTDNPVETIETQESSENRETNYNEEENYEETHELERTDIMFVKDSVGNKNLRVLNDGSIILKGDITANTGHIGGFTITETNLFSDNVVLSPNGINIFPENSSGSVFNIYDKERNVVFYIDGNGDLQFSGYLNGAGGTFSGELLAASGSFSGTIQALNGNILGRLVVGQENQTEEGKISSNIIIDGSIGSISSSNFSLDNGFQISSDGLIIANSITLGKNALINDYIRLGNSWIFNPVYEEENDVIVNGEVVDTVTMTNMFLRVGNYNSYNFLVDNDGKLITKDIDIVGGIVSDRLLVGDENGSSVIIDGKSGSIYSSLYSQTSGLRGWKIDKNGSSIFNNVIVRGQIESAVFQYNEIQTLSGSLLIRPSFIIEDIEKISDTEVKCKIKPKLNGVVEDGSYCLVQLPEKTINLVAGETINSIITFYSSEALSDLDILLMQEATLINLGKNRSIGISINSTASNIISVPESVTIFEEQITYNDNTGYNIETESRNNRLIMGRLPSESYIPTSMQNSFGLYSDNVFLKGQMISASQNGSGETSSSAGINTNGVLWNNPYVDRTEPDHIVIWAGANGDEEEDIRTAPFKVTREGFVFADQGYFVGIIESAEIATAKIIGTGPRISEDGAYIDDEDSGLTIQAQTDLSNVGIIFKNSSGTVTTKLLSSIFELGADLSLYNNLPNSTGVSSEYPYFYSKKLSNRISANNMLFTLNQGLNEKLLFLNNQGIYFAHNREDKKDFEENIGITQVNDFSFTYEDNTLVLRDLSSGITDVGKFSSSLVELTKNTLFQNSILLSNDVELKQKIGLKENPDGSTGSGVIGYDLFIS